MRYNAVHHSIQFFCSALSASLRFNPICTVLATVLSCSAAALAADWRIPETHPRLFINMDDIAALRVRCGIDQYRDDPIAKGRGIAFGSQQEALERLKTAADEIMRDHARADDLFAPAILHLVTGELGEADRYTDYVTSELLDPARSRFELDALVALDYCWLAIPSEKRSRIIERVGAVLEPLELSQNPLDHLGFARKLNALAAAIVLHGSDDERQLQMGTRLRGVLAQAKSYLEGPFTAVCRQRGAMPTSGENGIWEEADLVLATELWRSAAGGDVWGPLADSLGRALEHYFYADTGYAGLTHGFVHDDGSRIPLKPGQVYRGFVPAVPWVLATRARDPIANWFAHRSLPASASAGHDVDRYQWVRLLYGPLNQPEAARGACPLGRNFGGGWIAMRSGWAGGDTVLLFDAGQPFWRSRQHFDAGQFQIYRKGRLAIDSGDDVTFDAVASRGGSTAIGGVAGDWDDYAQATIAHNCVTVADPTQEMRIYGRPWPAMGNQRLIERDYNPSVGDVSKTDRQTGTLSAFETNSFFSYAAADLTAAYPPAVVRAMRRQILFVHAGAIVVLDRVESMKARPVKTWHLQLPSRPEVLTDRDGESGRGGEGKSGAAEATQAAAGGLEKKPPKQFVAAKQVHGVDASAGIWELEPEASWLSVSHMEGRLFIRTLLPADAQRRLVGGPMRPRQMESGPRKGTPYFGGEPFGYEHRLWPASMWRAPNAAYELGRPVNLGPDFGVGSTWGRFEAAPAEPAEKTVFLHLLIPTDAAVNKPPVVNFEVREGHAFLAIELNDQHVSVELSIEGETNGRISIRHPATQDILFEKDLATTITPNAAIPGSAGDPGH